MNNDILDHLKSLHTSAIDARNGYQEALEDAGGKGLTPLFGEMISLHERHANDLSGELARAGQQPDDKGSFMSVVHETIMTIRSLFNGLDESVLPGLIDGEKRNAAKYDDALNANASSPAITGLLSAHRNDLTRKIAEMEARKVASKPST